MSTEQHITRSDVETEAVAGDLARRLVPPAVVLLEGPLGAGKTTFVRGFVAALGGRGVKSPTYALGHSYATAPVVHHLDLYRLSDAHEAWELGLGEMVHDPAAFAMVEWPGNVAGLFDDAQRVVRVRLDPGDDDDERCIYIELTPSMER